MFILIYEVFLYYFYLIKQCFSLDLIYYEMSNNCAV